MRSRPRRLPSRAGALPLAALLGLTAAATVAAAPPPSDGVVDLLTAANAEIVGPSAGARVGAVGGGGDVNGDGRADVLVGSSQVSPAGRERAGSVWVLAGRAQPADVDLAAPGPLALARIDGAAPFDELGQRSVTVAGDINADGVADILVGAPGADNNGRVGSGSAYVVFGKPGLGDVDLAALGTSGARIDGAVTGQAAGVRVAAAGDVNRDGVADLLLDTEPLTAGQPSVVYIVFGGAGFANLDLASPGARAVTDRPRGRGLRDRRLRRRGGRERRRIRRRDRGLARGEPRALVRRLRIGDALRGRPRGAAGGADDADSRDGRTRTRGPVAGAGDLDGDGFDDVAIGTPFAPGDGSPDSGAVDVVRGGAAVTGVRPRFARQAARSASCPASAACSARAWPAWAT